MRIVARLMLVAAACAVCWQYRTELLRMLPATDGLSSAHARYGAALRARGLDDTELGRAWLNTAETIMRTPELAPVPFRHEGEFTAATPQAGAWRFSARRGQRVVVTAEFRADGELFLDLFEADGKNGVVSATADETPLTHDVRRDAEFVLRVQPELLRAGRYRISQHAEASFEFPVEGVSTRTVRSGFGAPREGGRRRHEGIDIFAPRGTPAVAAVDGWITGSTTNRLGGKVVWLWSPSRRLALYYAHLDRHAVARGDRVEAGDVVGYVGTTGNARGTPPHLHFGIYATGEGAIDPTPFVVDPPHAPGRRQAAAAR